jgi:hypothetical protein
MVAALLANSLNATLCKTFNPTEPGDNLDHLVGFARDNEKIVILLDEVDSMLRRISAGTIMPHKHVPVQITCKQTWNSFLDDMIFWL